jgi:hypothetical protein
MILLRVLTIPSEYPDRYCVYEGVKTKEKREIGPTQYGLLVGAGNVLQLLEQDEREG